MTIEARPLTEALVAAGHLPRGAALDPSTHLIAGRWPETGDTAIVRDGSYVPHDSHNMLAFTPVTVEARVGVFDLRDTSSGWRRAFFLALPPANSAAPVVSVLYGVMPHLAQNASYYRSLQAHLPVSDAHIRDQAGIIGTHVHRPAGGFVAARYLQQAMSSTRRPYALVIPIRALAAGGSDELGPFVSDGGMVRGTLAALAVACGRAFAPEAVDAFAHSSGGGDLRRLIAAMAGTGSPIRHAVALDPIPTGRPAGCSGTVRCYVSPWVRGAITGGHPPGGCEHVAFPRWRDEEMVRTGQVRARRIPEGKYLHDWAYPRYLLRVGLQAT